MATMLSGSNILSTRRLKGYLNLFALQRKFGILLLVGTLWIFFMLFIYKGGDKNGVAITAEKQIGPVLTSSPRFNISKRIAYVSRHIGTTTDFKYMAEHLQLENVDYYDASEYYPFQASRDEYKTLVTSGKVEEICSTHDAVFISDSLADGWPFIMDGEQACKNVVFVVTNRYDIGTTGDDRESFNRDFNHSLNRNDEYRGKIIVNNLFEVPYFRDRGIEVPDYHPLIRPFGYNPLPSQEIDTTDDDDYSCLIIGRVAQDEYLMKDLVKDHTSHHCKVLNSHYGGPKTLSLYDSIVVHLPYQVSIMKMWENLAYGVLMAIPSPEFFTKICDDNYCSEMRDAMEPKNVVGEQNWPKYLDFYLPGWEKCFLQFSSWDQLDEILTKKDYVKNINYCRDKMEDLRELGLKSWKEALIGLQ